MKSNLFVLFLTCSAIFAVAQTEVVRQKHFNVKKNLALDGYDVVSYFSGKPLEGSENFVFQFKGISYQFASASNRDKFKADPEKYEPAYGGWCAYAMGDSGEKVKVDPETYKIINSRLYLFYNFWGNNTLEDWNADEVKLKGKAELNWKNTIR